MNLSRTHQYWPALILFAIALLLPTGCGGTKDPQPDEVVVEPKVTFPPLPASVELQRGAFLHQVTLKRGDIPMKVWIYLPEKAPKGKLPCVLIAPSGTPLFIGMNLSEADRPEHMPYVYAGFAVVSYELDGHVDKLDKAPEARILAAAKAFKNARAGLSNARVALDYALAKVPAIDPERIYAAGHSSAATLSLLVAAEDPRIKACVAYAPVTNLPRRLGPAVAELSAKIPGFADFVKESSPSTHVDKLKCPVFLFHSRKDARHRAKRRPFRFHAKPGYTEGDRMAQEAG
jgi:acetyl esterase/lipase